MDELEFIKEVLLHFSEEDWGSGEDLFWRVEDNKVRFVVNANDLFYWACADAEEIILEDLPLLRTTANDLKACNDPYIAICYLGSLYACRKRGMRPQRPCFRKYVKIEGKPYGHYPDNTDELDPDVRALFDAAGPERDPKSEG